MGTPRNGCHFVSDALLRATGASDISPLIAPSSSPDVTRESLEQEGPAMKVSSISAAAFAVLVSATLGCGADRISAPSAGTLSPGTPAFGAVDQNESSTYTWHVNN